jgi:hypothetical protein
VATNPLDAATFAIALGSGASGETLTNNSWDSLEEADHRDINHISHLRDLCVQYVSRGKTVDERLQQGKNIAGYVGGVVEYVGKLAEQTITDTRDELIK